MSSKDIKSPINFIKSNSPKKVSTGTVPLERPSNFVRQIFPITYYHLSITDNDTLKELLVDKIVTDAKNLEVPDGWFTNKLMTSFDGEPKGNEIFFGKNTKLQKELEKRYGACINAVFDAPFKIDIDEIWYNVYVNGEWQEDHDHVGGPYGSHYSCIHFLSFDPKIHQRVEFRDPLAQLRNLSVELDRNDYSATWCPHTKEGDFIMFPSYLSHCVKPGKPTPDYPRITIAFNFRVLEYEGEMYND